MIEGNKGARSTCKVVLGGRFGEREDVISATLLDDFAQSGGHFIETAYSYADGAALGQIGRIFEHRPALARRLRVISKAGHDIHRSDLHPDRSIEYEIEASLDRLRGTRIEVLLLHRSISDDQLIPVINAIHKQIATGKLVQYGVANWTLPEVSTLLAVAKKHGFARPSWVSLHVSLAVPRPEALWPGSRLARPKTVEAVTRAGLNFLAWSSQARGWFSRAAAETSDLKDAFDTPANRRIRDAAEQVGARHALSASAVSLGYVLAQGPCVYASIGPETLPELHDSMAVLHKPLPDSDLAFLAGMQADALS